MSFHPNPVSMAVHVEHHRQELLDQARQYRMANEAARAGKSEVRPRVVALKAAVASFARTVMMMGQHERTTSLEIPQSASGEAR